MLVVQHEPVFCPTTDRLQMFMGDSSNRDYCDVTYHLHGHPCSHCVTVHTSNHIDLHSDAQVDEEGVEGGDTVCEEDCVDGAAAAREEFHNQLMTIGEDGDTLYERLSKWANTVAKTLVNETGEELLHRIINDAYSRICRQAFHPNSNWEGYLAMKLGFKREEIREGRVDEYRDALKHSDPWTIVSRFGRTTSNYTSNEYFRFLRRESQYLGLFKALKDSVTGWTSAGLPGSQERAWGIIKKLIVEIVLRETNNVARIPLAVIAKRLHHKDKLVRKASAEAFDDFYRILKNDPNMTETEFHSLMPKAPK